VFHGIGDIRLDDVEEPSMDADFDAVAHRERNLWNRPPFIRGTVPGMQPGTILAHEGVV